MNLTRLAYAPAAERRGAVRCGGAAAAPRRPAPRNLGAGQCQGGARRRSARPHSGRPGPGRPSRSRGDGRRLGPGRAAFRVRYRASRTGLERRPTCRDSLGAGRTVSRDLAARLPAGTPAVGRSDLAQYHAQPLSSSHCDTGCFAGVVIFRDGHDAALLSRRSYASIAVKRATTLRFRPVDGEECRRT
jgi:hypothetical protein